MAVPNNTSTIAAIQAGVQSNNWRKATDDLIGALTELNEPYSSGEIAAFLRTEAPKLKFSVTKIGEHVRDAYWAGTLPEYNDGMGGTGGTVAPVQVEQRTSGSGRTPAGQPVFIYGADQGACLAHDFEVDIPLPPGVSPRQQSQQAPQGTQYVQPPGGTQYVSPPAQVSGPTPSAPALPGPTPGKVIQPINQGSMSLIAKVISDRRVLVPRSAFEAYLYASGKAMRAGDSVFVDIDADGATISLDSTPTAKQLTIQADRGRLLFAHPSDPFNPGTTYTIKVDKTGVFIEF